MQKWVKGVVLSAALSVPAASASAQVSFPHQFDYQGSTWVFNGTAVGIFHGALDGGSTMNFFCTDFFNGAHDFTGYVSVLGGTDLTKTRFGLLSGPAGQTRYKLAAWLGSQFATQGHAQWGFIQYAIWQTMYTPSGKPNQGLSATQQSAVDGWIALAQANYNKYYYNNFFIITDRVVSQNGCQVTNVIGANHPTCGAQEFIGGDLTPVPEPATYGLLAVGLVGMSAVSLARRKKQRKS